MSGEARATQPEDVTRLVAERLNAGDAVGVAALYDWLRGLGPVDDRLAGIHSARLGTQWRVLYRIGLPAGAPRRLN